MFTIFNKQIQSCAFIVLKSSGSRSGGHARYLFWIFGEEEAFVSSASERLSKILYRNTCWRVTRSFWRGGKPNEASQKTSCPWGSEMWSRKSAWSIGSKPSSAYRILEPRPLSEHLIKVSLRWRYRITKAEEGGVNGVLRGGGLERRTMACMSDGWM